MKIVQTNSKGQVVIPYQIRKSLAINETVPLVVIEQGSGIFMYPISTVLPTGVTSGKTNSFSAVLKNTRGSWGAIDQSEQLQQSSRLSAEQQETQQNQDLW